MSLNHHLNLLLKMNSIIEADEESVIKHEDLIASIVEVIGK